VEHVPVDVIVQSLLADTEFRVVVDDLVRRLTLFYKRLDDLGDGLRFLNGQVDAFSGVSQGLLILLLSGLRNVAVLGEAAAGPVTASVAGTGRMIASAAGEGLVVGAVRSTLTPEDAFSVVFAFQRHLTVLNHFSVQTDLFTDRGLVFPEGLSDRGLRRFVFYSLLDNTPFLEDQVRKRVLFKNYAVKNLKSICIALICIALILMYGIIKITITRNSVLVLTESKALKKIENKLC
jgi:hypothetical protein